MSDDCESLEDVSDETNSNGIIKDSANDFPSMGVDLLKRINFKVGFFLMILGMFLFSDLFVETVLSEHQRSGDMPNTIGTTIQLIIFILAYIVIDLLVQGGIL